MKQVKNIGRNIKITLDIEKLLKMREELSKKYIARVGVLGQKNNRVPMEVGESHEQYKLRVKNLQKDKQGQAENEGLTNADIGMVHEFGSLSKNIRRRSFLEMPLVLKMPEYAKTFGNQLMKAIDEGNLRPVFINLGIKGKQVVQLAFASKGFGQWWQNPKTGRGSLIDTAQLRRSITSDVTTK